MKNIGWFLKRILNKNQPIITEEWIEERARELWDLNYDLTLDQITDFIRTLIEEISPSK